MNMQIHTAPGHSAQAPPPGQGDDSARARANRANAQWSTGPATEAGKRLASRNAMTHGAYGRANVLMGWEHPDEFAAFRAELWEALAPLGTLAGQMAETYIWERWKLRRVAVYEAELDADEAIALPERLDRFERLEKVKDRLMRSINRAHEQFTAAQNAEQQRQQAALDREQAEAEAAEARRRPPVFRIFSTAFGRHNGGWTRVYKVNRIAGAPLPQGQPVPAGCGPQEKAVSDTVETDEAARHRPMPHRQPLEPWCENGISVMASFRQSFGSLTLPLTQPGCFQPPTNGAQALVSYHLPE